MEQEILSEKYLLRLTPSDRRKIEQNASKMKLSMNKYILLTLRRKRIIICENLPELISQIQRIGNNINQIVRVANTNQYVSIKNVDEVKKLMTECRNLLKAFVDYYGDSSDESDSEAVKYEALDEIKVALRMMNNRLETLEKKLE